jgi:hypothetical protein
MQGGIRIIASSAYQLERTATSPPRSGFTFIRQ